MFRRSIDGLSPSSIFSLAWNDDGEGGREGKKKRKNDDDEGKTMRN